MWVQKGSVRSVTLGANPEWERNVTRMEGAWENISALIFLLRVLQYVPRQFKEELLTVHCIGLEECLRAT